MNSKQAFNIVILLIIVILFFVLLYYYSSEGNTCMRSPLTYGIDRIAKSSGEYISCSCYMSKPNVRPFIFDSEGVLDSIN